MSRFTTTLLLLGFSTAAFAHRLSTSDGPTTEALPACAENGQLLTVQDSLPPTITCPPNDTLMLSGLVCDTAYQYTVTVEDDAPGVILAMVSGIPSGGMFPAGTTTILYIAIDGAGNTATCSFSVQVNSEAPSSLSCRTLPTLSLNSVCSLQVYASDLLLPPFGCNNAYSVEVDRTLPFGNGPWVQALFGPNDLNKTYQCRITNLANGNRCWSNITLRDSLPPALVCPTLDIPCA